ncbi:MAG: hypothetical protein ACOX1G_05255 [bacterium]|jgi:hypothetical protein
MNKTVVNTFARIFQERCGGRAMKGFTSLFRVVFVIFASGLAVLFFFQVALAGLAAPAGLSVRTGNKLVTLSWIPLNVSDIAGYNIYRSDRLDGFYTRIGFERHPSRTFVDRTVANDTLYYYKITALDRSGIEGTETLPISALPLADRGKISLSAGYLACSLDKHIIEMSGNARMVMGNQSIEADNIQFKVDQQEIRARGNIRIHSLSEEISGELLFWDKRSMKGTLVKVEPEIEHIHFSGQAFTRYNSDTTNRSPSFTFEDVNESRVWMVARSATVYPSERINLVGVDMYVNGARIVGMPYYMLTLRGYSGDNLSYNQYNGLTISIPYYYGLGDRTFGLLKGSYSTTTKLGLGLEQYLEITDKSDCQLNLDRLISDTWSGRFRLSHKFDSNTYGDINVNYPSSHNMYGTLSIARDMNSQRLSLFANAVQKEGSASLNSVELSWRMYSAKLGHTGISYGLAATCGMFRDSSTDILDNEEDIQLTLTPPALRLSDRTMLATNLSLGHNWSSGGSLMDYAAAMTLDHRLKSGGSVSIGYQYSGQSDSAATGYGGQSISGSLYLSRYKSWRFNAYADYDLETSLLRSNLNLDVPVGQDWSFSLRPSYYPGYSADPWSVEVLMGRRIGSRDLRLGWSSRTGRVWGEFAISAF